MADAFPFSQLGPPTSTTRPSSSSHRSKRSFDESSSSSNTPTSELANQDSTNHNAEDGAAGDEDEDSSGRSRKRARSNDQQNNHHGGRRLDSSLDSGGDRRSFVTALESPVRRSGASASGSGMASTLLPVVTTSGLQEQQDEDIAMDLVASTGSPVTQDSTSSRSLRAPEGVRSTSRGEGEDNNAENEEDDDVTPTPSVLPPALPSLHALLSSTEPPNISHLTGILDPAPRHAMPSESSRLSSRDLPPLEPTPGRPLNMGLPSQGASPRAFPGFPTLAQTARFNAAIEPIRPSPSPSRSPAPSATDAFNNWVSTLSTMRNNQGVAGLASRYRPAIPYSNRHYGLEFSDDDSDMDDLASGLGTTVHPTGAEMTSAQLDSIFESPPVASSSETVSPTLRLVPPEEDGNASRSPASRSVGRGTPGQSRFASWSAGSSSRPNDSTQLPSPPLLDGSHFRHFIDSVPSILAGPIEDDYHVPSPWDFDISASELEGDVFPDRAFRGARPYVPEVPFSRLQEAMASVNQLATEDERLLEDAITEATEELRNNPPEAGAAGEASSSASGRIAMIRDMVSSMDRRVRDTEAVMREAESSLRQTRDALQNLVGGPPRGGTAAERERPSIGIRVRPTRRRNETSTITAAMRLAAAEDISDGEDAVFFDELSAVSQATQLTRRNSRPRSSAPPAESSSQSMRLRPPSSLGGDFSGALGYRRSSTIRQHMSPSAREALLRHDQAGARGSSPPVYSPTRPRLGTSSLEEDGFPLYERDWVPEFVYQPRHDSPRPPLPTTTTTTHSTLLRRPTLGLNVPRSETRAQRVAQLSQPSPSSLLSPRTRESPLSLSPRPLQRPSSRSPGGRNDPLPGWIPMEPTSWDPSPPRPTLRQDHSAASLFSWEPHVPDAYDRPELSPLTPSYPLPSAPRLPPRNLSITELRAIRTGYTPQSSRNNSMVPSPQSPSPYGSTRSVLFGGAADRSASRAEGATAGADAAQSTSPTGREAPWRGWTEGYPSRTESVPRPSVVVTRSSSASSSAPNVHEPELLVSNEEERWLPYTPMHFTTEPETGVRQVPFGATSRAAGSVSDEIRRHAQASMSARLAQSRRRLATRAAAAAASSGSSSSGPPGLPREDAYRSEQQRRRPIERHVELSEISDARDARYLYRRQQLSPRSASPISPTFPTAPTAAAFTAPPGPVQETMVQRMNRMMAQPTQRSSTEMLNRIRAAADWQPQTPATGHSHIGEHDDPTRAPLDAEGAATTFARTARLREGSPSPTRTSRLHSQASHDRRLNSYFLAAQRMGGIPGSTSASDRRDALDGIARIARHAEHEPRMRRRESTLTFGDMFRHQLSQSDAEFDMAIDGLLGGFHPPCGGLQPSQIAQLPTAKYKDSEEAKKEERCPICLDDYEQDDTVMGVTECGHFFHQACFSEWLKNKRSCPYCRQAINPRRPRRSGGPSGSNPRGPPGDEPPTPI